MKHLYSFSLACMAAMILLFSCKKDDGSSNTPVTTDPAKLIQGKWQVASLTSDKPYQWTPDYYGTDGVAAYGACVKSTTITFSEGMTAGTGTVLTYDNCNQANASNQYIIQNNILTIDGGYQRPIIKLTQTELVFTYIINVSGSNVMFTSSYIKK